MMLLPEEFADVPNVATYSEHRFVALASDVSLGVKILQNATLNWRA